MICLLVDCGQPEFPSNGVVSAVSSTTEGATVTFQCEEGLFPSDPVNITCSSTGLWTPNPEDVQCNIPGWYINLAISSQDNVIVSIIQL